MFFRGQRHKAIAAVRRHDRDLQNLLIITQVSIQAQDKVFIIQGKRQHRLAKYYVYSSQYSAVVYNTAEALARDLRQRCRTPQSRTARKLPN